MGKNFHDGLDWISATVVAHLGPLSYLLESKSKQLWQRHVDHVKPRTISPVKSSQPQPDREDSTWSNVGASPPHSEITSETVQLKVDLNTPDTQQMDSSVYDPPMTPESNNPNLSDSRQYPGQEHCAPDCLDPKF